AASVELGVVHHVADGLHRAGRHARGLERVHRFLGRALARPGRYQLVERVVVALALGQGGEARLARPGRVAERAAEALPLGVRADDDDAPGILARAGVAADRRAGLLAVALGLGHAAVDGPLQVSRPEQRRGELGLRGVHVVPQAGAAAV